MPVVDRLLDAGLCRSRGAQPQRPHGGQEVLPLNGGEVGNDGGGSGEEGGGEAVGVVAAANKLVSSCLLNHRPYCTLLLDREETAMTSY